MMTLKQLEKFMRLSPATFDAVLFSEIDVRSPDEPGNLLVDDVLNQPVLHRLRITATESELGEHDRIVVRSLVLVEPGQIVRTALVFLNNCVDVFLLLELIELLHRTLLELDVLGTGAVSEGEVNLVNDREDRNLVLRDVDLEAAALNRESAVVICLDIAFVDENLAAAGLPAAEIVKKIVSQPGKILPEILQLVLGKPQRAVEIDLPADLSDHLWRKLHVGVAALERPDCLVLVELVQKHLPHVQLI